MTTIMANAVAAVMIAVTFLYVQSSRAGNEMKSVSCDLVRIAEDELKRRYSWFVVGEYPRLIEENGNRWTLTYELPATMIGGVPTIVLDKRTCDVLKVEHSQ